MTVRGLGTIHHLQTQREPCSTTEVIGVHGALKGSLLGYHPI